jgi:hypothetical protein
MTGRTMELTTSQYEELRLYEDGEPKKFLAEPNANLIRRGALENVRGAGYRLTAFGRALLGFWQPRFQVRVVFLDGVERTVPTPYYDEEAAIDAADRIRAELAERGYDRRRVHVDAIDNDDPERGSLEHD